MSVSDARAIARTEVLGRRVNEALERDEPAGGRITVLCECGHTGCTTKLEVARDVYERARERFDRFLIAPGHEIAGVESVIERHQDYVLIRKEGEGRRAAADAATDIAAD